MPDLFKLSNCPQDAVSNLVFEPGHRQHLAASSWDCTVRIYDIVVNSLKHTISHSAPVLDCAFSDNQHVLSGGLDKELHCYFTNSETDRVLGKHEAAISKVHMLSDINAIATGSWDATVRIWDTRTAHAAPGMMSPEHVLSHPNRIYTMDSAGSRLVVGTAQRKILIWDLRNLGAGPVTTRDSPLKYQTRCIRCFSDGQGYVIASIEGRIGVEYFDSNVSTKKKYAFKCHRVKVDKQEHVYSVNAIAFHRRYGTFASGGSDSMVHIWDAFNQKRLEQLPKFDSSITALAFSDDGSALAIGASDMNEDVPIDQEVIPKEGQIYIRYVTDQEVKPKEKAKE